MARRYQNRQFGVGNDADKNNIEGKTYNTRFTALETGMSWQHATKNLLEKPSATTA